MRIALIPWVLVSIVVQLTISEYCQNDKPLIVKSNKKIMYFNITIDSYKPFWHYGKIFLFKFEKSCLNNNIDTFVYNNNGDLEKVSRPNKTIWTFREPLEKYVPEFIGINISLHDVSPYETDGMKKEIEFLFKSLVQNQTLPMYNSDTFYRLRKQLPGISPNFDVYGDVLQIIETKVEKCTFAPDLFVVLLLKFTVPTTFEQYETQYCFDIGTFENNTYTFEQWPDLMFYNNTELFAVNKTRCTGTYYYICDENDVFPMTQFKSQIKTMTLENNHIFRDLANGAIYIGPRTNVARETVGNPIWYYYVKPWTINVFLQKHGELFVMGNHRKTWTNPYVHFEHLSSSTDRSESAMEKSLRKRRTNSSKNISFILVFLILSFY